MRRVGCKWPWAHIAAVLNTAAGVLSSRIQRQCLMHVVLSRVCDAAEASRGGHLA